MKGPEMKRVAMSKAGTVSIPALALVSSLAVTTGAQWSCVQHSRHNPSYFQGLKFQVVDGDADIIPGVEVLG